MADRTELLNLARTLGRLVAQQPEVRAFNKAREALMKDADAMRLNQEYSRHVQQLQQMEMQGKPIEVADKRKLQELQSTLAGNDSMKNVTRFQADYLMLMELVQKAMDEAHQEVAQAEAKQA
ncbi:MAG: YlbF family regulator [Phycisphaerae bacterium]